MKLAFSTNAFTRFSLEEAISEIAAAGFGAVEILADSPHADPGELVGSVGAELARRVRGQLERLGLSVSNINNNCSFSYWRDAPPEPYFEPSLISPSALHRADRAERIRRSIDFASAIGAPAVSITTGKCLGAVSPEVADRLLGETLPPLLEYADRRGVNVGIECEPGLYVEWASELRGWIDRLGHPRLGANLDTGHSHVLGESMMEAFGLLRGRIWNLHVEDLPGRKHYHMVPGTGSFPFEELMSAARATGYAGPATVELYTQTERPSEAARASMGFLGPLFGRGG